jgi:hypothetical protein
MNSVLASHSLSGEVRDLAAEAGRLNGTHGFRAVTRKDRL